MYTIKTDMNKNRVLMIADGEHNSDMEEFIENFKKAALKIREQSSHFDILTDLSHSMTLQQDRTQATMDLLAWCKENGLRRSANVVGSTIQKMQVRRLSSEVENIASFTTLEEAERWLSE